MKKILLIILLIAIIGGGIAFVAINMNKPESSDDSKIDIVVSNFSSYDFLRAIIKDTDGVNLKFLLGPGKDAHSYEPSPQDMIDIQESDMFVYIGGELEMWADKIVETLENPDQKVVQISNIIELKEEMEIEGAEHGHHHDHDHDHDEHDDHNHEEKAHEHEHDDHNHEEEAHEHEHDDHEHEEEAHEHNETAHGFDAHIWTSPENAKLMIEELAEKVADLDTENAEKYKENAKQYINEINEVDNQIKSILESKARNKLVFGDKMPMQYFIEYYDLDVSAAFQGCSTETEPSSKTMEYLIEVVKNENIPVVLYTEMNDGRVANLIISEAKNGSTALQMQTLHNVTKDKFENGATWVSLMKENIEVLEKALK